MRKQAWKTKRAAEPREVPVRWTPQLAALGWTPVSDFFLDNYSRLGITNLECLFLIHLIRHKWTAAMPFPGFKRLAARMGVTPTAVRSHARRLERKGFLVRVERTGRSNKFDLQPLFAKLEALHVSQTEGPTPRGAEPATDDEKGMPAEEAAIPI